MAPFIANVVLHTLADSSTLTITSDMNFTKISVGCSSDATGTVNISSSHTVTGITPLGISLAANESWSWDAVSALITNITIDNSSGENAKISLG